MFWEYSPSSANIASDWLRAKRALLWMRKKYKWMTVSIVHSLRRELTYLLTCERRSLVSWTQNDVVFSWITMLGMIKVYWLDFSLRFGSCCLPRFCRQFGPKLASHYKPVKKTKYSSSSSPNHVRGLKVRLSSIKKRIIIRRAVWTVRPIKNAERLSSRPNGHTPVLLPLSTSKDYKCIYNLWYECVSRFGLAVRR